MDLTKKELKSVLISGHIIKREQIKESGQNNLDQNSTEIIFQITLVISYTWNLSTGRL